MRNVNKLSPFDNLERNGNNMSSLFVKFNE